MTTTMEAAEVLLLTVHSGDDNSTLTTWEEEEVATADGVGGDTIAFVSHTPGDGDEITARFLAENTETPVPDDRAITETPAPDDPEIITTPAPDDSKIMKRFQEHEEKKPHWDAPEEDQKNNKNVFEDVDDVDVDDDDHQSESAREASDNKKNNNKNKAEDQNRNDDAGGAVFEADFEHFGIPFDPSRDHEDDDGSVSTEEDDDEEESLSDAESYLSDEDDELNLYGDGGREFENVLDGAFLKSGIMSGTVGETDLLDQTGAAVDKLVRRLSSLSMKGGSGQKKKRGPKKTGGTATKFSRLAASRGPYKPGTGGKKTKPKGSILKRLQNRFLPEDELTRESSSGKTVGIDNSFSTDSDDVRKTEKARTRTKDDDGRSRDSGSESSGLEEIHGCGTCFGPEELVELFPMATMGLGASTSNDEENNDDDHDHEKDGDCEGGCATKSFDDANELLGNALDTMQNHSPVVVFREQFTAPCSPSGGGDDDVDTVPKDIRICHQELPSPSPSERLTKWLNRARTRSTNNSTIDTYIEDKNDGDHDEEDEIHRDPEDGSGSIVDGGIRYEEPRSDSNGQSSTGAKIDPFSTAKNVVIRRARSARSCLACGGEKNLMGCVMDDAEGQVVASQKTMPLSNQDHQAMPGLGATISRNDKSGFVDPAILQAEAKNLAMSVKRIRRPLQKPGLADGKTLDEAHRFPSKTAPGQAMNGSCVGQIEVGLEDEDDEDTIIIQEEGNAIVIHGIVEDRSRSFPFDEQSDPNNIVGDVLNGEASVTNAPSVRVFSDKAEETETSLEESERGPGRIAPRTRVTVDTRVLPASIRESIEHAEMILSTTAYGLDVASPSGGDAVIVLGRGSDDRSEIAVGCQELCAIELSDVCAIEMTHPMTSPESTAAAAGRTKKGEQITTGTSANDGDNSIRAAPKRVSSARKAKKKRSLWKLPRQPKEGSSPETASCTPPSASGRSVSHTILMKGNDVEVAQISSHRQEIARTADAAKDKFSVMKSKSRMVRKLRQMPSLKRRKNDKHMMIKTDAATVSSATVSSVSSSKPVHKVLAVNETGCEITIR